MEQLQKGSAVEQFHSTTSDPMTGEIRFAASYAIHRVRGATISTLTHDTTVGRKTLAGRGCARARRKRGAIAVLSRPANHFADTGRVGI